MRLARVPAPPRRASILGGGVLPLVRRARLVAHPPALLRRAPAADPAVGVGAGAPPDGAGAARTGDRSPFSGGDLCARKRGRAGGEPPARRRHLFLRSRPTDIARLVGARLHRRNRRSPDRLAAENGDSGSLQPRRSLPAAASSPLRLTH